jgi:hypothetical protein
MNNRNILVEDPFAWVVVNSKCGVVCNHCLADLQNKQETKIVCESCKIVAFCSKQCQDSAYHEHTSSLECLILSKEIKNPPHSVIRLLLKVLIRDRNQCPATTTVIYKGPLTNHGGPFNSIPLTNLEVFSQDVDLVDSLDYYHRNYLTAYDRDFLMKILCRTLTARRFIWSGDNHNLNGYGLYLTMRHIKHSCCPNTTVRYIGNRVVVRQIGALDEDGGLTCNYGNFFLQTHTQRNQFLKKYFFIECRCKMCLEEEGDGVNIRCYRGCGDGGLGCVKISNQNLSLECSNCQCIYSVSENLLTNWLNIYNRYLELYNYYIGCPITPQILANFEIGRRSIKRVLMEKDPRYIYFLKVMLSLAKKLGDINCSFFYTVELMDTCSKTHWLFNPTLCDVRLDAACLLVKMGKYDDARMIYNSVKHAVIFFYGDEHPQLADLDERLKQLQTLSIVSL